MNFGVDLNLAIVIPTFNEQTNLGKLLVTVLSEGVLAKDIYIADGGSSDRTKEIASSFQVNFVQCPEKGRAPQMNHTATLIQNDWLYFIHADTIPPNGFLDEIKKSIDQGAEAGSFRSFFDSNHPLLSLNAFFTRFDKLWCRGGDQTLFVKKSLFDAINGYCQSCVIMEDYDIIERLQAKSKFHIMPKSAIISTRKYKGRSYWKVMRANYMAFKMYKQNQPSTEIRNTYLKLLGE